jgi:membrane protein involved in colicin uptake
MAKPDVELKAEAEAKAKAEAEAKAKAEAKRPCEYCQQVGKHANGCPAVTKVACEKMGCPGCGFKKVCKHEFKS